VENEILRARLVGSASRDLLAEFFRCGNNSVPLMKREDLTQIIVYTYVTNRGVCAEEKVTEST
jgi:hypothetical protein